MRLHCEALRLGFATAAVRSIPETQLTRPPDLVENMRHEAAGSEAAYNLSIASAAYEREILHAVFANDGCRRCSVIFDIQGDWVARHQVCNRRIRSSCTRKCPHPIRHGHHSLEHLPVSTNVEQLVIVLGKGASDLTHR